MNQMARITPEMLHTCIKGLPALPSLTTDMLGSFDQDNVDVAYLAQKITRDQSLTTRTLRIANSPFYGLSGQVGSIHDAIIILGFRTVRSLVLSAGLLNSLVKNIMHDAGLHQLWRHSIGVAVCARALAQYRRSDIEMAFIAGLIHNMGQIVLHSCFPQEYAEAVAYRLRVNKLPCEAERDILGLDYMVAGAELARHWRFPNVLIDAIQNHYSPDDTAHAGLTDFIHIANILAHALELSGDPHPAVPTVSEATWARIGLDWQELQQLFSQVEHSLEETCQALCV